MMVDKKNQKIISLKEIKEKKNSKPGVKDIEMSDDEISLNANADSISTFLDGIDGLIEAQTELEKKVNKGQTSKSFARFFASWVAAFEDFNKYYEIE